MASGQSGIPRGHAPARRYAAVFLAVATALALAGCGQAGQGAPVAPRTMSVSSAAFVQNILPRA